MTQVRVRDRVDLGQFFLEDKEILQKIVDSAMIQPNEVVLEIGAGDGRMTKLLAEKAKKVLAIEIDEKFLPELKKLPKNVEIIINDALEYLPSRSTTKLDKILGNLPSTLVEPLFPKLTKTNFKSAVFLVPEKFAYKLASQPVLSAYFEIKLITKVSKKSFLPVPRTNWEIVLVTKIVDPLKSGKIELFLIRYIYEHPNAKLKNSLMEVIIKVFAVKGKKLTKNQAREIVAKAKISPKILESLPTKVIISSALVKKISVCCKSLSIPPKNPPLSESF